MSKKLSYDCVRSSFEAEGYTLLSEEYKGSSHKLKYRCPNGHERYITWNKWNMGRRCPYCSENGRVRYRSIEEIRKILAKEGYTLISTEYKGRMKKLKYICPNGHKYETSLDAWLSKGNRCGVCSGNAKLSIDFVRSEFEKEGYKVVSKEYVNASTPIDYVCPNGHKNSVLWLNWYKGNRCPNCINWGKSKGEEVIADSLKKHFSLLRNDRTLISPNELDIVIPNKKLAIEYCGLYWHSEKAGKKKKYHYNKLMSCKKAGYRLITIFEDELYINKDLVIEVLLNILNYRKLNDINVRKCIISEIPLEVAHDFCNTYHIQGYQDSEVNIGVYNEKELVSIMSFSLLPAFNNCVGDNYDCWEITRFCSKTGVSTIDIAAKLLSYFKDNYNPTKLIAYSDRRWSEGDFYKDLGFIKVDEIQPNCWGFKGLKRFSIHRAGPSTKTAADLNEIGCNRIWDCGSIKYEKRF